MRKHGKARYVRRYLKLNPQRIDKYSDGEFFTTIIDMAELSSLVSNVSKRDMDKAIKKGWGKYSDKDVKTLVDIKQYSPLFDTTFDKLIDEQIREQIDVWEKEMEL